MDFDISNLLYIAFAILYFVFTARKKDQNKKTGVPSSSPDRRGDTVGPMPTNQQPTFEELLEQFTGQRKAKEEPKPFIVEEPTPKVAEEVRPAQVRKSIYTEANKVYGAQKRTEKAPPIMLFDEPDDELTERTDYASLVSDTDGARKAFVMGEIFNRKY